MRGWLGIFSTGMDALADKIDKQAGAPAVSVADEEWRRLQDWLVDQRNKGNLKDGPLVLLGHSYGADDMIRVAGALKQHQMSVDLLVLLDPVTPPKVPTNVKRVYCVYKSHPLTDWYPAWRGVPADVEDPKVTELTNIDLRTATVGFNTEEITHVNVEKVDGVHKMIMEQIMRTCSERMAGAARPSGLPMSAARGVPGESGGRN
jgi:pimeloyl-ACP methyl ester carboxylesterase